MSCPAPARIAAAASGEHDDDDPVLVHAAGCARCEQLLDDQRGLRDLVQRLPDLRLPPARREAMAAEVMAQSDRVAVRARRHLRPLLVAGLAVAAATALLVGRRASDRPASAPPRATPTAIAHEPVVRPIAPEPPSPSPSPSPSPAPALASDGAREPAGRAGSAARREPPAPSSRVTMARLAGTAEYTRAPRGDHEVVALAGGELTIDAIDARPVSVVAGDTTIAVRAARAKVIATGGVISAVAVFAGSVELTVGGRQVVVDAGMVWERPSARDEALAAFRAGWTALREARHADAIAAFDQATDATIAEDALYWSAIASERAGDPAGAVRRYRALLTRFPSSPRADAARTAIARLAR